MRKFSRIAIQIRSAVNLSECTRNPAGLTSKSFSTNNKGTVTSAPALFNSTQQTRKYVPTMGRLSTCWNCNQVTVKKNRMVCDKCGRLQDVDTEINYFELLDFPKTFQLEPQKLTQRFRQLQTLVHPDKYSNKTSREQENSADWSSLINKAYKTLSAPLERGEYILYLHGLQIPQDNSALDKEFLMEMMERNEEVEEAQNQEKLQKLIEKINNELDENVTQLHQKFDANALDDVKALLVKMKYLHSIQSSIKKKMQSMLSS